MSSRSEQPAFTTNRVQELASEINSALETIRHGRLLFNGDELEALETASHGLAKIAANVFEEVQALGKRRKRTVVSEGQRLLSNAETVKTELMATHRLKNQVTFVRNIQLFFIPPIESKLDSSAVKARKKLTRERADEFEA
ncbi:hypothetical protein EYZ11_011441 [Aspergillus tanneri]|uniref:Uncharacterized protein n=1 Tax=Aspergillus tanneri TaxID=1220188 RepID=A0A4V3UMY7_9EURO|nr:hypothetical protein EYZ11_011441 [Aspergillus tanneri]